MHARHCKHLISFKGYVSTQIIVIAATKSHIRAFTDLQELTRRNCAYAPYKHKSVFTLSLCENYKLKQVLLLLLLLL
jgi:hypothetical protein